MRYCANFDGSVTIIFAKNQQKTSTAFSLCLRICGEKPEVRGGQVVNAEELRNLYLLRIFDSSKKGILREIWKKLLIYERDAKKS